MSVRSPLRVHLYGRHVADLLDAGGNAAVRYTPAAQQAPARSRLSLSLPVRESLYPATGPGGRFVRSLLPEGRTLAWAVEHFGIPEDDRFGLIAVLGRDVAGAVEVVAPGSERSVDPRYEVLSNDELVAIVERAHTKGLGLDRQRGIRLSLAGLQDKVLLHQVEGRYAAPIDGAPSTLIVKPEYQRDPRGERHFDGIATNELYCLTLARRCGFSVPPSRVERFGGISALVVERYDRQVEPDGTVRRIHQEDLCSALGVDPLLKYEKPHAERHSPGGAWGAVAAAVARPGPTLRDLAGVLAEHVGRAKIAPFLQAVTFNVAIGNADAHARNYSVLLHEDGAVTMAPLYDLVSTRMWDWLDRDAAQSVAGEEEIDEITGRHLVEEAVTWDIPETVARKHVTSTLTAIERQRVAAVEESVASGGDAQVATRIAAMVRARLERMLDHRSPEGAPRYRGARLREA
ncbi:MAG TPA: HipA domain-containing protein [Acidimicrobiia bacterium]|nr:HipA domain-containing protein [Acidimicrobiia bacterium]